MHDRNFGMFRGQRSTLGNGLSGEPLKAACHHFALPTTWRSTTAQGSRMRYSQCENAPLVLSSLYLPAGQFNRHKAKSGALQGWEDQRCSPDNRLLFTQESCGEQVVLPFRIRVHPFTKINQWAVRWFQGLLTLIWAIDSDFSQHAFLLPWKCAEKSETAKFSSFNSKPRVQGLKWYNDHCRPCLAMIVDLLVLPGLCFQSLSTFYCRFHCRPLNRFGSVASNKEIVAFVCGTQTNKDEMNCRIKVWPMAFGVSTLSEGRKTWSTLISDTFLPSSAPRTL